MKTEQERVFNIPMDVCLDVFKVLLENGMAFSLVGIKEQQNSVVIKIPAQGNPSVFQKGTENIENILRDYKSYLKGYSAA